MKKGSKLFIAGASNLVGKNLVKEALSAGYEVTAWSTDLDKMHDIKKGKQKFKIIEANMTDTDAFIKATENHRFLVSTFDGEHRSEEKRSQKPRAQVTKLIVEAAKRNSIEKVIVMLGASLLRQHEEGGKLHDKEDIPDFMKDLAEDLKEAYAILKESNINWTGICPPTVTNLAATGRHEEFEDYLMGDAHQVSVTVGDLVEFILEELKNDDHKKKLVGITTYTPVASS